MKITKDDGLLIRASIAQAAEQLVHRLSKNSVVTEAEFIGWINATANGVKSAVNNADNRKKADSLQKKIERTGNLFTPEKYATGSLIRVNGSAFVIMAYFRAQATSAGWIKDDIDLVISNAKRGDYESLIAIIEAHLQD